MKKQTKSILQATKKETFVIGGCGYPIEMSSTDERIAALMGTSAYDFDNGFDSDASNKLILNLELFTQYQHYRTAQGAVAKCEEEDEGAEHGQDLESICVVEDSFIKTEPTEIHENSECIETEAAKEVNHKVTNLVNCFNKS